jgi:hypothetical protein
MPYGCGDDTAIGVGKYGAGVNTRQDYATPPELIACIEKRFGKIMIDLAAHEGNHVCPLWIGPGGIRDDLKTLTEADINDIRASLPSSNIRWIAWLNPPFSDIPAMISASLRLDIPMVINVPDGLETEWYEEVGLISDGYVIKPRVKYVGMEQGYPKNVLAIHVHRTDNLKRPLQLLDWRTNTVRYL